MAGLPFDSLDITKPNDCTAYNAQIKHENDLCNQYRQERGVSYKNY
ncbi:MAG: hypothetical protein LBK73_10020 [Treponema sp.]|nr:hypothetical protein [Treponema sp.]